MMKWFKTFFGMVLCAVVFAGVQVGCLTTRGANYYEKQLEAAQRNALFRTISKQSTDELVEWTLRMEDRATSAGQRDRARIYRIYAFSEFCGLYARNMELLYDQMETSHGKCLAALAIARCFVGQRKIWEGLLWLDEYESFTRERDPMHDHAAYMTRADAYAHLAMVTKDGRWYEKSLECYAKAAATLPWWAKKPYVRDLFRTAIRVYESKGSPGEHSAEYWRRKLGVEDAPSGLKETSSERKSR